MQAASVAVTAAAVTVPFAFAAPWTTTESPGWTSSESVEAVRVTSLLDLIEQPATSLRMR